jgi:hypothetical protein
MHRKACRWRILAIQGGLDLYCVAVTPWGQQTDERGDKCRRNDNDAGPSDRAIKDVCLQPLACWVCGFESHGGGGIDVCLL